MKEEELPEQHEGEKPFFAGERKPKDYGYDYDKDVVPEEPASFQPFSPAEAARLAAKLAVPGEVTISPNDKPEIGPEVHLG